jgi:hypothetical protein
MPSAALSKRRAIGIIRVSQKKGREGDSFVSPEDRRDRIRVACERNGLELIKVLDELDGRSGRRAASSGQNMTVCARWPETRSTPRASDPILPHAGD